MQSRSKALGASQYLTVRRVCLPLACEITDKLNLSGSLCEVALDHERAGDSLLLARDLQERFFQLEPCNERVRRGMILAWPLLSFKLFHGWICSKGPFYVPGAIGAYCR